MPTNSDKSLPELDGWALVLGASSGFGASACSHFALAGMNVVGVHLDRRANVEKTQQLVSDIQALGREAWFYNVNAADPAKRAHVHALPEKAALEIQFPRVVGYRQAIRNRVTVDWDNIAQVILDPLKIPPEVEVKAALPNNTGKPSLHGPGKLESIDLQAYRQGRREQELAFELARDLTRDYLGQAGAHLPAHVLFPQVAAIVRRYLK